MQGQDSLSVARAVRQCEHMRHHGAEYRSGHTRPRALYNIRMHTRPPYPAIPHIYLALRMCLCMHTRPPYAATACTYPATAHMYVCTIAEFVVSTGERSRAS